MNVNIEEAKKENLDEILNIFNSITEEERSNLALNQKLSLIKQIIKRENHCYVAKTNNKIVGFLRESGRPDNFSLLEEIVVDPNYRNKGIASKLLECYHNKFNKNLAKTKATNNNIISLLKKYGYKPDNINSKRIINWKRS